MKEIKGIDSRIIEDDNGVITAYINASIFNTEPAFTYMADKMLRGLQAQKKWQYHDRPAYQVDDRNTVWVNALTEPQDFKRILRKAEQEQEQQEQEAESNRAFRRSMAQSAEDKLDSLEAIIKRTAEEAEKTRKKLDEIIRQIATD